MAIEAGLVGEVEVVVQPTDTVDPFGLLPRFKESRQGANG